MAEIKKLSVWLYGKEIGGLKQTSSGKMVFSYLPNASCNLSLALPVKIEPYDEIQTEAYFGGLLPESEQVRKILGKRYGVNHNNNFSLLKAIGYDCAGAVSLYPSNKSPAYQSVSTFPLSADILSDKELELHIKELPRKPLFLGIKDLRLSLAGAQDKAAICLVNNSIALPKNGCPSTHILKPDIQGVEGSVYNEYFCMRIASRIGLNVARVELRRAQKTPYLLVERYDRVVLDQLVRRIHQEDFCQALGVVSSRKYQNEGGPDFKVCFDLLKATTQPVKTRNELARLMIFNYLIGNMDAHAKNFSILCPEDNQILLAPAYDILCTKAYEELSPKMAMKIGGVYKPEDVYPRHWEKLSKEIGYSYPLLCKTILQDAESILKAVSAQREEMKEMGLSPPVIDKITSFLEKHINKTIKHFD